MAESKLWEWRRKRKISGWELSKELGISQHKLSRVERNREELDDALKEKCSQILGVPKKILFPTKLNEEFRNTQIPFKENILKSLETTLKYGISLSCRKWMTEKEINNWLFDADELLERMIEQRISLDNEIQEFIIKKIKAAVEEKNEHIQKERKKILDGESD